MIYLNARCRHAEARVALHIDELADKHCKEIRKEFRAAQKRLGLSDYEMYIAYDDQHTKYVRALLDTRTGIAPWMYGDKNELRPTHL
jgi:hypothetical protein